MSTKPKPRYRRILLKMSGEALMGNQAFGLDPKVVNRIADEVRQLHEAGVQVAIVIGGGNLFRGAQLAALGMERVTGDHMGMLATLMNSLAMQDALEQIGVPVRTVSALRVDEICEPYIRRRAIRHLEKGNVVISAAGTGNPFFTTDSAASLRAIELEVDAMFKATKVDGIYTKDPNRYDDAVKYHDLSYQKALTDNLGVMDATSIVMCRDNHMPLIVFDMTKAGEIIRAVFGEDVGTIVHA
ncbi:UMP kinase [Dichelobacter nodosus]|uniref:Uridylate kinase n=1 Tax=Dichelobacter nodosus (strain VCS1703A) TaxID=246195 RepID=PYRH_DICNV|nr:UMP kinase [Dichelobacter nodosus]A5EV27.1 RecName: Full=Uridylate kinase; Short=UK; AltName: Full=Uridine monophosphate kinase; Short=UMP kinase; Short=UMPK [Dichelobacter nodosus VCS1703A]ABQ13089.1 uridylate kinase [Dichelobacter nodosus VCS1703A]AXM45585.1 UMP kinase [Dichelobacter nodosus]KNZ38932.1 uridylate kinase [Dichelobacter nodosus]TGA66269.1 UMP kinase [Dichelobacter nodosus]